MLSSVWPVIQPEMDRELSLAEKLTPLTILLHCTSHWNWEEPNTVVVTVHAPMSNRGEREMQKLAM